MKHTNRVLSLLLTGVLLLGLLPAANLLAGASNGDGGEFVPTFLNGSMIINAGVTDSDNPPTTTYEKSKNVAIQPDGTFTLADNASAMGDSVEAYNMIRCFGSGKGDDIEGAVDGFTCDDSGVIDGENARYLNTGVETENNNDGDYLISIGLDGDAVDSEDQTFNFSITIAQNPVLKMVAASGQLQFYLSGLVVSGHEGHAMWKDDHCRCQVWVKVNNTEVGYGDGGTDTDDHHLGTINTGWQTVGVDDVIHIKVDFSEDNGGAAELCGLCEAVLLFRDISAPELSDYVCSHSASSAETTNASTGDKELLVKLGTKSASDPDNRYYEASSYNSDSDAMASREWVKVDFNFSEPVTMGTITTGDTLAGISDEEYEALAEHALFTNTPGTGYLGQGQTRGLRLQESAEDVGTSYLSSISYQYTATYGDFYGNNPIPNGGCIESGGTGVSLLSKIGAAGFHDAAGNPLVGVDGSKGVNIFDKNDGGFDVIVDAVPPTYSRVGSGITPDILTQLVLNKNDTVDFIVSFSEATITKRGWDNAKTYLMLDNGDKAYFKSKSADGKQWVFTYTFKDGGAEEASLLKVIALANDALNGSLSATTGKQSRDNDAARTFNADGRTITDYVGNVMSDRANEDSSTNTSQIESSIGWAGAVVDNTVPDIAFDYSVYGTGALRQATDTTWGQAAKVLASAVDPDVPVAKYDPDYSSSNTLRPSKGIYRPDNTTGNTASAVGLIFYVWTRNVTPPSTGENFEAIKRYSLTGEQPKTVDRPYADDWNRDGTSVADYVGNLMMANNFSDIIPPDAAMKSEGDGAWYLHVWTADMTWDSARMIMQYEKANLLQYKSGYNNAEYLSLKQNEIDEYRRANTENDSTPTFDEAWDEVKETVYSTAYTDQFLAWLDESGSDRYSDAAMLYAKNRALMKLTAYADTAVWQLSDYTKDDSNWTVQTTRLLLDNTKPSANVTFLTDNMIGDGTAAVELPFVVSDALSGLDTEKVYYQWVLKKSDGSQKPDEVQWIMVEPDGTTAKNNALTDGLTSPTYGAASALFTAKTLGNVIADGTYILYLKYYDVAGNETVTHSGTLTATVNSANGIACVFGPDDAVKNWRNEIVPTIRVTGVSVGKLVYTVTTDSAKPNSGYAELAPTAAEDKSYSYTLPALSDAENTRADGTWYVHVLVYENAMQSVEPHYFRQAYRLDRTKPEIFINQNGFSAAQDTIDTVVSFSDGLSGMSGNEKYRISSSAEMDLSAEDWKTVPGDGRITLHASETGNYYLHILAPDRAGNIAGMVSAPFALRGTTAPAAIPPYRCQLLTRYVAEDGKTYGVANLTLDTEDKTGYRYSVTTNGRTWCNWLPYMSMIRLQLPDGYRNGDLKVKFRAPDGTVGEAQTIDVTANANTIWATAEFDSTFKRKSVANGGAALTLLMEHPANVIATPEGEPAATPVGGDFRVSANGVYTFTLSEGEQTASSPLIVVVDIFDDTAPAAYIGYSEVAPTNGTVVATVMADEVIRVKGLKYKYIGDATYTTTAPKAQFGFERNGTAVFTIEDEAHNETTVTATVSNIDKNAPNVKVDPNYDLYKKVETPSLIASGATLEVKKGTEGKQGFDIENFDVVNNDRSATMEINQNGSYEFIVQDKVGNVTGVTHTTTNIVTTLPKHTVTLCYAVKDSSGNTVAGDAVDTAHPRQGEVLATVTFDDPGDGRALYSGATKIDEYRNATVWDESTNRGKTVAKHITNALDKANGKYVYTRVYTANGKTAMVFCDDLGNVESIPISITGIDNVAPLLTLNKKTVVISNDQPKRLSELTSAEIKSLFGGYTIEDNAYATGFTVSVERSDDKSKANEADKGKLNEVGKFTLIYTVTDPAGNVSYTMQTLIVIPSDGLLIEAGDEFGNGYVLLSGSAANNAILPDNHVRFRIDTQRMQTMFYNNYGSRDGSKKVQNSDMRYDIFYTPGLYREGQLKTIATQLTGEQLTGQDFLVTFPKAGWYTIIIRNQERTREYTTFFIASASN